MPWRALLKMLLAIALLFAAYLALNSCQSHRADGLPSILREYVEHVVWKNSPHREAASSLGISLAAGNTRSFRARDSSVYWLPVAVDRE
jgi:hypothetical protein